MGLEKYFCNKDPVDFCKVHPLIVNVINPDCFKREQSHKTAYASITLATKPEDFTDPNNIAYKMGKLSKNTGGPRVYLCNIFSSEQKKKGFFPVYYLHWEGALTRKIHLGKQNYPANFFITAGINGCAIFIEGDEDAPVVSHSNASGKKPAKELLKDLSEEEQIVKLYQYKRDVMLKQVKESKSELPSYARAMEGTYVTGLDYLHEKGPEKAMAQKKLSQIAKSQKGTTTHFLRKKKTERAITEGTVFGVRNTKTFKWTFYMQKRATGLVKFKYPKIVSTFLQPLKKDWKKALPKEEAFLQQYPISVEKIFPGGNTSHGFIHVNL